MLADQASDKSCMAAESRLEISMVVSGMQYRLLRTLEKCNSKTTSYLKREVLHVIVKCLGGVYGPCNMGDVEGFSCRVVKTKHYVDLHIDFNIDHVRAQAVALASKPRTGPPTVNLAPGCSGNQC